MAELQAIKKPGMHGKPSFEFVVARPGIEPGTQGFSIPCSTN